MSVNRASGTLVEEAATCLEGEAASRRPVREVRTWSDCADQILHSFGLGVKSEPSGLLSTRRVVRNRSMPMAGIVPADSPTRGRECVRNKSRSALPEGTRASAPPGDDELLTCCTGRQTRVLSAALASFHLSYRLGRLPFRQLRPELFRHAYGRRSTPVSRMCSSPLLR